MDLKIEGWKWYGDALHLCVSAKCRFHLATEINDFVISTVGDYWPTESARETITSVNDGFYETGMFRIQGRCDCGCGEPEIDPTELKTRVYATPGEANAGHLEMCFQVARGEIK